MRLYFAVLLPRATTKPPPPTPVWLAAQKKVAYLVRCLPSRSDLDLLKHTFTPPPHASRAHLRAHGAEAKALNPKYPASSQCGARRLPHVRWPESRVALACPNLYVSVLFRSAPPSSFRRRTTSSSCPIPSCALLSRRSWLLGILVSAASALSFY